MLSGTGGLLGGSSRGRQGHMIEVVLNGRSDLYTVYKRPFVDYFLKKVCDVVLEPSMLLLITEWHAGLGVVYTRHIHGVDARVC